MPIKGLKGGIGTKALGYGLGGAVEATDPEFNQTVLLLHADGSEGEGNTAALGSPNYKAFKDNSTSAHALVVQGDAYGNDFSPYYYADGYWSTSFKGSGAYQTFPNSSAFAFGTGAFTIEFWFDGPLNNDKFILSGRASVGTLHITFGGYGGSTAGALRYVGSSTITTGTDLISDGTWHHVAIERDGSNNVVLYIDGVSKGTGTDTTNYTTTSGTWYFGANDAGQGNQPTGHFSNFRIVKGSNVYGSAFTPPSSPLTAVTNTQLLIQQSNRFVDNSTNAIVITNSGDPKISTNTPFTVTKTANVGSGFFDGDTTSTTQRSTTGDKVFTTSTSSDFAFGTGDFTVECWVYPNGSVTDARNILSNRNAGSDTVWALHYSGAAHNQLHWHTGATAVANSSPHKVIPNAWNHLAVTRESGTARMYINGVQVATWSDSYNYSTDFNLDIAEEIYTNSFNGYIADAHIIKGTAKYTGASSFSIPTSTISADSNTKFLALQYSGSVRNVGFLDDSKHTHRISRNGDVSMGTFSPFSLEDGYWSVYFDGSDAELNLTNTATIGTGNFTMEMWVFPHNRSNSCLIDSRSANGATDGIIFKLNSSKFQISGNDGTTNIPLNEWTHLAVVREGTGTNETKMYVNGALEKTITFNLNLSSTFFGVGVFNDGSNSGDYKGYISNLRVVNDTVYTGAFTVPSTPLTAISNTDVLICQSNRFIDNSTNGFAITVPQGTPKVLPFSPFAPTRSYSKDAVGGSAYFDGSGDSLKINPQNDKDVFNPTITYTLEGWVYVDIATPGTRYFLSKGGTDAGWSGTTGHYLIMFYYNDSVYIQVKTGSGSFFGLSGAHGASFQWNHFAVGFDGTTTRFWWNGETINSTTTAPEADTDTDGDQLYLGVSNDGSSGQWAGYISNVRYVFGTDIYGVSNASITVPTSPPTAVTNTNFLTTFTNAGIIDHTMKNNLETEGNVRISGQQTKFSTGSIYFDGTDDLIVLPHSELQQLDTGEFTVELFVYFTATDQRQGFFGNDAGWYFQIYDGELEFALSTSAIIERAFSHSLNQWYHLAATRDSSNDVRLFIDGTQQGAVVNSTADLRHASNKFHIGNIGPGTTRPFKGGYMDEIRIIKGAAKYTSNFTVPTEAFANR